MISEAAHSSRICRESKCDEPAVYIIENQGEPEWEHPRILWPVSCLEKESEDGLYPLRNHRGGLCRTHAEAQKAAGTAQVVRTGGLV